MEAVRPPMRPRTMVSARLLFAIPFAMLACTTVARAGAWLPARGEILSQVEASVFSSDSYYDANGARRPIGGLWEERTVFGSQEIGLKRHMSLRYTLPMASVTARGTGSSTSTGLSDVSLGLRYGLLQGGTAAALSVDWSAPLGYDRWTSLLGEGLQQLQGSLDAGVTVMDRGFVQGSAGFAYRYFSITRKNNNDTGSPASEGFLRWANLATTSADAGWWVRPRLLVGGRYQGVATMSQGDGEPKRNLQLAGAFALLRASDHLDVMAGSWSGFSGKYELSTIGTAPAPPALHYDQVYVAVTFRQTRTNRLQGILGSNRQP